LNFNIVHTTTWANTIGQNIDFVSASDQMSTKFHRTVRTATAIEFLTAKIEGVPFFQCDRRVSRKAKALSRFSLASDNKAASEC
jgi:hypothetical protein